MVRIPRLVRLVRAACQCPEDDKMRTEATALALKLHRLSLEKWVKELFKLGMVQKVISSDMVHVTPQSLSFRSSRLLVLLCQYWETRILICGCIERLATLTSNQSPSVLPLHETQSCEVDAAKNLVMSFEQMHTLAVSCAAVQLRFIFSIQMAFAAFYRLEQREEMKSVHSNDFETCQKAGEKAESLRNTQTRLVDLQDRWAPGWHPTGINVPMCQMLADIYSGGPVPQAIRSQHKLSAP
jgi:hypothetical protein